MAFKTMLWYSYPSLPSTELRKRDINDVTALLEHPNGIELIYADGYKRRCYPVLTSLMVDYKKQVFIIGIKANMQYSIYHVLSKERELVSRLWEVQTHQSIWTQLEPLCNNLAIQQNRAADDWLQKQKCFA